MNVYIVGMGPGNPNLLTEEARQALERSSLIIGDKRMTAGLQQVGKKICLTVKSSEIRAILASAEVKNAAVVVSGDVGFFSLAALLEDIPNCTVQRICGISSLVYFAAKLGMPWQDARIVSRHGRQQPLISVVYSHEKVFCLTGGEYSVAAICAELCRAGLEKVYVYAGENLSYHNERLEEGTATELSHSTIGDPSVMMILNRRFRPLLRGTAGIDDEAFQRGSVPMTKAEIRAVSMAKLRPAAEDVIYDVGAGTGACSIELALQAVFGRVFAFEVNSEAISLLHQNIQRFGTDNITVISGMAPQTMTGLPAPDCAFIGGTKGNIKAVLDCIYAKNPQCRIVITAITVETLAAVTAYYAEHQHYAMDISQITVSVSRKVGTSHMMMGRNPVYIIRAVQEDAHDQV